MYIYTYIYIYIYISGPILERKYVRIADAWREKKIKTIENSRNCKNIPFRGAHT